MREHHKKTIENLVNTFKDDKRFSAIIIYGSIAKKQQSEDADVDVYFVAADEEFEKRKTEKNYRYVVDSQDICVLPCKYIDGKIVNLDFLINAAKRGSEPLRASFADAFIAYSHIDGLEQTLRQIPVYPEDEQIEKMRYFYSLLTVFNWYISEAHRKNDRYLLIRSAAELVFYGGRLVLAYNKMLYPYHKWFMHELNNAPAKPENVVELAKDLLECPCADKGKLFFDCIMNYTQWEKIIGSIDPFGRFMEDVEWNWLNQRPLLGDL